MWIWWGSIPIFAWCEIVFSIKTYGLTIRWGPTSKIHCTTASTEIGCEHYIKQLYRHNIFTCSYSHIHFTNSINTQFVIARHGVNNNLSVFWNNFRITWAHSSPFKCLSIQCWYIIATQRNSYLGSIDVNNPILFSYSKISRISSNSICIFSRQQIHRSLSLAVCGHTIGISWISLSFIRDSNCLISIRGSSCLRDESNFLIIHIRNRIPSHLYLFAISSHIITQPIITHCNLIGRTIAWWINISTIAGSISILGQVERTFIYRKIAIFCNNTKRICCRGTATFTTNEIKIIITCHIKITTLSIVAIIPTVSVTICWCKIQYSSSWILYLSRYITGIGTTNIYILIS